MRCPHRRPFGRAGSIDRRNSAKEKVEVSRAHSHKPQPSLARAHNQRFPERRRVPSSDEHPGMDYPAGNPFRGHPRRSPRAITSAFLGNDEAVPRRCRKPPGPGRLGAGEAGILAGPAAAFAVAGCSCCPCRSPALAWADDASSPRLWSEASEDAVPAQTSGQ